ncbi:hypothetical protein [Streptomyces sp. URMC 123]|uniref:hypothetical protein n=1 Tax=Streptomyces sp. URMC 123 TaxID=3423403 RepID=UPI003F1A94EA
MRPVRGRRRAVRRTVAGALLLAALAGCGIESTGVVEIGEPAVGIKRPGQRDSVVRLFFLSPTGIRPAPRPAAGEVGPEEALRLLFRGPDSGERQRGFATDVPEVSGPIGATVAAGRVDVAVPVPLAKLTTPALSQIVCTAANSSVPGGRPPAEVDVRLAEPGGGRFGPVRCDGSNAFLEPRPSEPSPSPTPPR